MNQSFSSSSTLCELPQFEENQQKDQQKYNEQYFEFNGQKVKRCNQISDEMFIYKDMDDDWSYGKIGLILNLFVVYYFFNEYMWIIYGFQFFYLFFPLFVLPFTDWFILRRNTQNPVYNQSTKLKNQKFHGVNEFNIGQKLSDKQNNLALITFKNLKQTWFFTWNITFNCQLNKIHYIYKMVFQFFNELIFGENRVINKQSSYWYVLNSALFSCINGEGNLVVWEIRLPCGNYGILRKIITPKSSRFIYKVEAIINHELEIIEKVNVWQNEEDLQPLVLSDPFQIMSLLSMIGVYYAHVQIHKSAVFISRLGKSWKHTEQASLAINGLNTIVIVEEQMVTGKDTKKLLYQNANRGYPHEFQKTKKLLEAKSQLFKIISQLHVDPIVKKYSMGKDIKIGQQAQIESAIINCLCTHSLDHYVYSRLVPMAPKVDFLQWNGIVQSMTFSNWSSDIFTDWCKPRQNDELTNKIYDTVKLYGPDICKGYQWAACE